MSIQSTGLSQDEKHGALVVSPGRACVMLDVSRPKLYELLNANELESYHEGRFRKITVDSIRRRIARLLAEQQNSAA